jgi:4-hydroxy-3-methylbut-2-enyl diphosphate reductase
MVIKSVEETRAIDLKRKTVLFSQTTMDKDTFYKIAGVLKEKIREFEVGTFEESAIDFHAKDTICGQVSGRDKKLREFAALNEVMIFVAGRNSSNGKVLYEICRDANPETYFVEDESELNGEWFRGKETVGISGATSTPQWLMERVKLAIERIAQPVEV